MDHFLSLFQFNLLETIALASLFVLFLIQLFFYCFFYNKPLKCYKQSRTIENNERVKSNMPSVSVIITATDEHENLEQCLPVILNQDYTDYEVIVVNNGLTDETDMLLKGLKLKYPHLYDTFLPKHSDMKQSRKKMAVTIGIKAAKKEVLLFTEADTIPSGDKWIASMMQKMTEDKDVVLGYCSFNKSKKFTNRVARFDNLLFSLQYMASALIKKPYTGIYRNVAYRKELFFDNKGFSSFLNYENSDGIFLNCIMSSENTVVSLSPNSFVSTDLNSIAKWENLKKYQSKIKRHFRNHRSFSRIFLLETFSRYLFYIFIALAFIYSVMLEEWGMAIVSVAFLILKTVVGATIISSAANYLFAGKFKASYIILELLQPAYSTYLKLRK